MFSSPAQAAGKWRPECAFTPAWDAQLRQERLRDWNRAVRTTLFEASLRREKG
jgi:glycerol kinase